MTPRAWLASALTVVMNAAQRSRQTDSFVSCDAVSLKQRRSGGCQFNQSTGRHPASQLLFSVESWLWVNAVTHQPF